MNADITSAGVYTDFQGLARLRHASKDQSPEALRAVAKQFEALFMQMMLKNMRDASLADGIFDSDQTEFYQEMFDKQISISMSERQGLGIADMIVKQLDGNRPDRTTPRSKPLDTRVKTNHEGKMESPVDFVSTLKPLAERAGKKAGLKPDVLLAQAALETGWGRGVINHPDGRSSHNLFGIKADDRWQGERVVSATIEFEGGVAVRRNEVFRSYASFEDSFRDYVDFLKADRRYDHALTHAKDPEKFVNALQEAGYASDPEYAQKINMIMKKPVFTSPGNSVKEL